MKRVTVIIPASHALQGATECIRSVLATVPRTVPVAVIATDSTSLGVLRSSLSPAPNLLFFQCNSPLALSLSEADFLDPTHDVALLQSNTIVSPRWLQNLRKAASSRPQIGAVSPLTNSGPLSLFPCSDRCEPSIPGLTLPTFAKLVERVSRREYPTTNSSESPCIYLRRTAIDAVGFPGTTLDEREEFLARANERGFEHIIDDATYICHQESSSELSQAQSTLGRESSAADLAFARVYDRIWNGVLPRFIAAKKRVVLHLLHNGPFAPRRGAIGGTELHVQEIIQHDNSTAHFSLIPGDGCATLTAHTPLGERSLQIPATQIPELFSRRFFNLVHFHHSHGFDPLLIGGVLHQHGRYIVSLHDYHLICGRLWLYKPDGTACDGVECGGSCGEDPEIGRRRREIAERFFQGAARLIVFSESSRSILKRVFGERFSVEVLRHGIRREHFQPLEAPPKPDQSNPLKIVSLGTFTPHKGSALIAECAQRITSIGTTPVEWHFLGRGAEATPGVRSWGAYSSDTLRSKLAQIAPHVALLPPQCQESYSRTVDEIIACGVPLLVSPFGAPPERVLSWKVGEVVESSPEGVHRALQQILSQWDYHEERLRSLHQAPLLSIESEISELVRRYDECEEKRRITPDSLTRLLQPELCPPHLLPLERARKEAQKIKRRLKLIFSPKEAR